MIAGVRADIRDLRSEMRDLRSDMSDFRTEMIRRFEQVDSRFNWVIGLLFAVLLAMVSSAIGLLAMSRAHS